MRVLESQRMLLVWCAEYQIRVYTLNMNDAKNCESLNLFCQYKHYTTKLFVIIVNRNVTSIIFSYEIYKDVSSQNYLEFKFEIKPLFKFTNQSLKLSF